MIRSTVCMVLCGLALATSAAAQQTIGGCTVLPPENIWNTPVDTLPVRADSATLVNTIGAGRGFHADFGSGQWDGGDMGIAFVKVPGSQTKYPVTFLYAPESDPGPYAVPLNAPIEGGSGATGDRHAIAIDTTNCILYELYYAFPEANGWNAGSGAIFDLKSNALRPAGWTSGDAAGLPIVPGLITYDEVASGEIKHAIRFTVPQTRNAYVWPARHIASSLTGAQYPRMGERFRLKASFDVSSYPAEVQVILRAMKKYGILLADNGSAWYISGAPDERWNNDNLHTFGSLLGSNFEAIDATGLMVDPNSGATKQTTNAVTVAVNPSTATVRIGHAKSFVATVTGASSTGVTWSVNGINGGNTAIGTIDASGQYIPPTAVPSPATVTLRATSTASPTTSGTASVTIIPKPSITSISPNTFKTGSFSITVTGAAFVSGSVVTFDGAALPTTFVSATSLTATGNAPTAKTVPVVVQTPDGDSSNTASVTVTAVTQTQVSVAVSPTSASVRVRASRQFVATVQGATNTAVTWKVNNIAGGNGTIGRISQNGTYTAPNQVPQSGTVTITATAVADSTKSATANVTITRR
ncbi:MAG: hypothetical protein ABMA15_01520 [Vicinamibacterales bacterium]